MADHTVPIAPIPLARSTGRLLVGPLVPLVAGGLAVAGGIALGDARGIGLVAAGLVAAVLSLALAVKLLTVRMDVEVATLRVRWFGGERRYTLVRGPVTRIALRGPEAARLRPRFGALGWGLGRARLRRDEQIEVVRLARTTTMILVPTDKGRLGVAPASEQQLLGALAAAARIQQRLDEVAERARAFVLPEPAPRAAVPISPDEAPLEAEAAAVSAPRVLTGIERAILEEHLAAERAAALLAAEAERQAATQAASDASRMAAFLPAEAPAAAAALPGRPRRRSQWRRPGWLSSGRPAPANAADAAASADVVIRRAPSVAAATIAPAADARPPAIPTERLVAYGIAVFPAVAAGIVWAVAAVGGRLELPVEQLRPIAVALLATGPAGAVASLMARAWFPRLLGLMSVTSLLALGLVARALLS
jgi:hypothetical protein